VRALIVTGIWPPDVGGPASHAPELAGFLHSAGHDVEVVTMADEAPATRAYPVRWTSRALPVGVRHLHVTALVARRARRADVVYSTGMYVRSTLAAAVARRPLVLKLTSDPAFERALWRGLYPDRVDDFQRGGGGFQVRVLRAVRNAVVRRARHVLTPSTYLRELAVGWGARPDRVTVLPNSSPPLPPLADVADVRSRNGMNGRTLVFAGRLTAQKTLEVALGAVARSEGVSLLVVGDGAEREPLEREVERLGIGDRVRFLGSRPREGVLELFRAADATILSSTWENFPHGVVESLAVGTPVLATRAGGVAEIVEHERNGLLVEPGDTDGLAAAIARYFADDALRERLRAEAAPSVVRYAPDATYGRLVEILAAAARP
jgi:glycosyltransferase involved in cell wall biosynthesis